MQRTHDMARAERAEMIRTGVAVDDVDVAVVVTADAVGRCAARGAVDGIGRVAASVAER